MEDSKTLKTKHYKVTWPGGFVSTFQHAKDLNFTEKGIKETLPMRKNGRIVHPVKVKRIK